MLFQLSSPNPKANQHIGLWFSGHLPVREVEAALNAIDFPTH